MAQSVYHVNAIGQQAQAALMMALAASDNPSSEFVRGAHVALSALCVGVGAPLPRLPERREALTIEVVG